jgi:TolB-like protein
MIWSYAVAFARLRRRPATVPASRRGSRVLDIRAVLPLVLTVFISAAAASASVAVQPPGPRLQQRLIDIKRVAILPFHNISGKTNAGDLVTNIFVTEIFRAGLFQVEEPGNVSQFMIQEKLNVIGEIGVEWLKTMHRRFGVDAVIVGTVEEFDDGTSSDTAVPLVSVTIRMIDAKTGNIIWSAQNKRKGDEYIIAFDFGLVRSVNTLSRKVISEMIHTLQ